MKHKAIQTIIIFKQKTYCWLIKLKTDENCDYYVDYLPRYLQSKARQNVEKIGAYNVTM